MSNIIRKSSKGGICRNWVLGFAQVLTERKKDFNFSYYPRAGMGGSSTSTILPEPSANILSLFPLKVKSMRVVIS